jgi:hypothetical protein
MHLASHVRGRIGPPETYPRACLEPALLRETAFKIYPDFRPRLPDAPRDSLRGLRPQTSAREPLGRLSCFHLPDADLEIEDEVPRGRD